MRQNHRTVYLTPDVQEMLRVHKERTGEPIANAIRRAIRRWMETEDPAAADAGKEVQDA